MECAMPGRSPSRVATASQERPARRARPGDRGAPADSASGASCFRRLSSVLPSLASVVSLFRKPTEMPNTEDAFGAATHPSWSPGTTSSSALRSARRSPRERSTRSSAWAASGAPSGCSGGRRVYTRPRPVTRAGRRRTRRTRRSAPAGPATTRSCSPFRRVEDELRGNAPGLWEGHDPTQGMRQGNDVGTKYRSGIYWTSEAQREAALASRDMFQAGALTRRLRDDDDRDRGGRAFYYAEDYHQQYLEANPNGYCGLGGTGVTCPAPATAASE